MNCPQIMDSDLRRVIGTNSQGASQALSLLKTIDHLLVDTICGILDTPLSAVDCLVSIVASMPDCHLRGPEFHSRLGQEF